VGLDLDLSQGVSAYALRQASLMTALATSSVSKWSPALQREGVSIVWASKFAPVVSGDESATPNVMASGLSAESEDQNDIDDHEELDGGEGGDEDPEEDDEASARFDRYDLED